MNFVIINGGKTTHCRCLVIDGNTLDILQTLNVYSSRYSLIRLVAIKSIEVTRLRSYFITGYYMIV